METHTLSTVLDNRYYSETQRINPWLASLLSLFPLLVAFLTYSFSGQQSFDNNFIILPGVVSGLFALLFFNIKLQTNIDENGIHYKFSPFQLKFKTVLWSNIKEMHVKQYRPLTDFGGWGIRFTRSGRVYNIKGKSCLRLEFDNNKGVFIGTQQPVELAECLKSLQESSDKYVQ